MGNKAIVVGGGVIGCSTALFLAREGWEVTLLEKGQVGSGASTAAAGLLSPPFFLDPDQPEAEQNTQPLLSRKGYDFYPEFLDLLAEYSELDTGYRQSGMWYLAFTEDELEEKETIHREMKKFNRPSEWATGDEVRNELPLISSEVLGGLFITEEAQVDPNRLLEALEVALNAEGVTVREESPVKELRVDASPTALTPDDEVQGDALLVAAGAWSKELGQQLGVEVPVEPRKGEMLSLEAPGLTGEPPVRRGERFVLPRQGRAILGSTTEDAGFDTGNTAGAMRDLLESGIELIPHITESNFIEAWSGFRPYAAEKGGAFLGQFPNTESVYYACGHYKTGILQGPYTGKLMSDCITGETPELNLERYSISSR